MVDTVHYCASIQSHNLYDSEDDHALHAMTRTSQQPASTWCQSNKAFNSFLTCVLVFTTLKASMDSHAFLTIWVGWLKITLSSFIIYFVRFTIQNLNLYDSEHDHATCND
jgi:hypothetical protein